MKFSTAIKILSPVVLICLLYFIGSNFYFLTIFFILLIHFDKREFNKFLFLAPLTKYFIKLYSSFSDNKYLWSKFDMGYSSIYSDLKIPLKSLKCSFLSDLYIGQIFLDGKACSIVDGYGPIWRILKLNFSNLNSLSNLISLFSIIFLSLVFFVLYKRGINKHILLLLSLSPTINLLINQQNLDIWLFLSFLFIYLFIRNTNFILFLLFILTLFKIHPYFSLFGILIFAIKLKKNILIILSSTTIIFSTYYIFISNPDSIRPTGPHNATGLLSVSQHIWIELFERAVGYRIVIAIYLSILLFIFFFSNKISYSRLLIKKPYEYSILLWIFGVYLFANYDYRNFLLIIYLIIFQGQLKIFEKKIFLIYLFLSPFDFVSNQFIFYLISSFKILLFIFIFGHLVYNLKIIIDDLVSQIKKYFKQKETKEKLLT